MESAELFSDSLKKLETTWRSLPDKPEETPDSTLRALWFFAAGMPVSVTRACQKELPGLNVDQETELSHLIEVKGKGFPLAYITGRQEFMGLELLSKPGAMIPRKETEILATAALEIVNKAAADNGRIEVLDLCTGSGNVALFLANRQPACRVTGVDISPQAVDLAYQNAGFLSLSGAVEFIVGDLFQAKGKNLDEMKFDVIVCNPPYIASAHVKQMPQEIAAHEPAAAFDGGPFGLNIPRRLIKEAPAHLKYGSWLCFEVGLGQGKGLLQMMQRDPSYQDIQGHPDANGEIRAITARTAFRPEDRNEEKMQGDNHGK